MSYTLNETNVEVEFTKRDFHISEPVSAEAQSIYVLGVDWNRLVNKKSATIGKTSTSVNIPVVGATSVGRTGTYALYNLMADNPGYDVVFYPQYEKTIEKPVLGLGNIYRVVYVKVTARLGKLKED